MEATSTTLSPRRAPSSSPVRSLPARSKARLSMRTHSGCSASASSPPSINWTSGLESCHHVRARRERLHPGKEPPLRLRVLPGILGLARSGERGRKLRSVRHDFDVTGASKRMEGFSAADVEAVALDAIRLMVRRLDKAVTSEHVAYAIDLGRRDDRQSDAPWDSPWAGIRPPPLRIPVTPSHTSHSSNCMMCA